MRDPVAPGNCRKRDMNGEQVIAWATGTTLTLALA